MRKLSQDSEQETLSTYVDGAHSNECEDVDASLVLTHATPARALRAYFHNIAVVECMGPSTSEPTRALAGRDHCVVELRALVGGGYSEKVHILPPAPPSPAPNARDLAGGTARSSSLSTESDGRVSPSTPAAPPGSYLSPRRNTTCF